MSDLESDAEIDYDSDSQLQEAFEKGVLKPGLNTVSVAEKKSFTNNVPELKKSLSGFRLGLPWIERLDLVTGHAPLAPELAAKLEETQTVRANILKNSKKGTRPLDPADDPVVNDFKREMNFHRQAQAAVIEALPRLKDLGVPVKRPDDYFAQMAKSDEHMQKVREHLQKKQHAAERSEKVRQIRQMRKMQKQIQVQSKLKRASEKKEMLEEVKKFRKKVRQDLDFLDDKKPQQRKMNAQGSKFDGKNKWAQAKKKYKDKKFGFGGKKRGLKTNTKDSFADMSEFRKSKKNKMKKQFRPGKSKRVKQKARKKN